VFDSKEVRVRCGCGKLDVAIVVARRRKRNCPKNGVFLGAEKRVFYVLKGREAGGIGPSVIDYLQANR
jgi:hypothetical protein